MLQMFVLALSLYNTRNRGVFLLCKITNLLIYSYIFWFFFIQYIRFLFQLHLSHLPFKKISHPSRIWIHLFFAHSLLLIIPILFMAESMSSVTPEITFVIAFIPFLLIASSSIPCIA